MSITKPIYFNQNQLNAIINGNFPETIKAQARDAMQQIQEEEASVRTWGTLKKALEKFKQNVISADKLIAILQNNGWKEPQL